MIRSAGLPAGTLADVSPSLAAALGVEGFTDTLDVGGGDTGWARSVALLLVDGMGADLVAEHADRAPALAELAAQGRTLRAGFPATTAVSVTSLGTGLPPTCRCCCALRGSERTPRIGQR